MYLVKKKNIFFILVILFFLIIFSNIIFATKLYDNWVVTNDIIKIENFTFKVNSHENILILNELNSSKSVIVSIGESKIFNNDLLFSNQGSKNIHEEDYKKYNISGIYSNEYDTFTTKLIVTKVTKNIEIIRDIKPSNPSFFNSIIITTKIKNSGNSDLTNLEYVEKFPIILKLNNYTDVNIDKELINIVNNELKYKFNLKAGEEKVLVGNFNIIGFSFSNNTFFISDSKVIYDSFNSKVEVEAPKKSFSLDFPLSVSFKEKTEKFRYKQDFNLTLILENKNNDYDVILNDFKIILPKGVNLKSNDYNIIKISDTIYQLNGKIEKNEKKEFVLTFNPNLMGSKNIIVESSYNFRSLILGEKILKKIDVEFKDPTFDFDVKNPTTSIIRGGDTINLNFHIQNNENVAIDDVYVEISSNLFNNINYKFLKLNHKTDKFDGKVEKTIELNVPSLKEDIKTNFTFKLSLDVGNELKIYEKTKTVNIDKGSTDEIFDVNLNIINLTNDLILLNLTLVKLNYDVIDSMLIFINSKSDNHILNLENDDLLKIKNSTSKIFYNVSLVNDNNINNDSNNIQLIDIILNISKNNQLISKEYNFIIDLLSSNILIFDESNELLLSKNLDNNTNTTLKQNESNEELNENNSEFFVKNESKFIFTQTQIIIFVIIASILVIIFGFISFFSKKSNTFNFKSTTKNNYSNLVSKNSSNESSAYSNSFSPSSASSTSINSSQNGFFSKLLNKKDSQKSNDNSDSLKVELFNEDNSKLIEKKIELIPKPGSGINNLENYIKINKNFGKSNDEIKKELKSNGWLDEVIDIFLK
jgi:hypothetical protein